MKKLLSVSLLVGAAVVIVVLASGVLPQNSSAEPQPASPPAASAAPAPVAAEIPATPIVPPPSIPTASPLAQIVRLTQANVDQGIIMTCVTNSSGTFNLDADRIIYLNDLGVPNNLITAMMQRDQQLQQQFAAAQQAQQAPPPQPAPVSQSAPPVTTEVAAQPEPQPAPVTINYFNDTLTPYGSWVVVAGYGRCWRPTAVAYNPGWQPYCDNGNWVYTDCGWYWNSSYAWGATFHYGRWFLAAGQGWCWYPDTVWAPSWVTWRYSANYCGWAPLPPRTYCQPGVGIVYQGGVGAEFSFGVSAGCFTFVPTQYFCSSQPRNYCAAPAQVTQIYNQTKVINNIHVKGDGNTVVINNGIPVQNVAATTQTQIRPVPVHEIDRSFAHDGHKQLQSSGSPGQFGAVNRPNPTGNAGSTTVQPSVPARTATSTTATGQNPPRSTGLWGNGNNRPAQSQFSPPSENQTPQPNQTATAPQTGSQFSHARNQTDRSQTAAPVSQSQTPTANNHSPMPAAPVQAPAVGASQQPATTQWQQLQTPRNATREDRARQNAVVQNPVVAPPANYSAPQPAPQPHQQNFNQPRNDVRQNYSAPANANAAPQQQNAPSSGSTPSSSQPGGGRNQAWGTR